MLIIEYPRARIISKKVHQNQGYSKIVLKLLPFYRRQHQHQPTRTVSFIFHLSSHRLIAINHNHYQQSEKPNKGLRFLIVLVNETPTDGQRTLCLNGTTRIARKPK